MLLQGHSNGGAELTLVQQQQREQIAAEWLARSANEKGDADDGSEADVEGVIADAKATAGALQAAGLFEDADTITEMVARLEEMLQDHNTEDQQDDDGEENTDIITVQFHNGLELQMEAHELLLHMPRSVPEAALIVVNAQIRALFRKLDTDGTGVLGSHELQRLGTMLSENWTESRNENLHELICSHGGISFLDFEFWITGSLQRCFNKLDLNCDAQLQREELLPISRAFTQDLAAELAVEKQAAERVIANAQVNVAAAEAGHKLAAAQQALKDAVATSQKVSDAVAAAVAKQEDEILSWFRESKKETEGLSVKQGSESWFKGQHAANTAETRGHWFTGQRKVDDAGDATRMAAAAEDGKQWRSSIVGLSEEFENDWATTDESLRDRDSIRQLWLGGIWAGAGDGVTMFMQFVLWHCLAATDNKQLLSGLKYVLLMQPGQDAQVPMLECVK